MPLSTQDRLRLDRGAEHLHSLGPRAVAEFLAEIAATTGSGTAIMALLAGYQDRMTPALLRAVGGDRMPPRAVRPVAA